MEKKKPFTVGRDVRGDTALFIPEMGYSKSPELIRELKEQKATKKNPVFWRMIDSKGNQMRSHGWMIYNKRKKLAEIIQWG